VRVPKSRVIALAVGWIAALALAFYILREDLASAALIGIGVIVLAVGLAIVASGAAQRRRPAGSGRPRVAPAQTALGVVLAILGLAALGAGLVKLFTDELERQREAARAAQPASPDSSARRRAS
jgi:multisubunit Na+/H+ antiporter MnhC subunit